MVYKTEDLFIGVMSGTSLDGIDVALVRIEQGNTHLIASLATPFTAKLKNVLTTFITDQHCTFASFGQVSMMLANEYAIAINTLLHQQSIDSNLISAIGVHGQTVFHQPDAPYPHSLQLVNASVLAEKTGITCVHNFREMDLALGGQGAPLVPLFHQRIAKQINQTMDSLVFANIGGIANISMTMEGQLVGFDTGPGNTLIDSYIQHALGHDFDPGGEFAKQGQINHHFLQAMLADDYFSQPAPKSTGREYFNLKWLNQFKEYEQLNTLDILATLTELTAMTLGQFLKSGSGTLALCGGGAKNTFLKQRIAYHLPRWHICNSSELGIDADFMEAIAFAWFAYRTINQLTANEPSVTGAKKSAVLGQITFAP